MKYKKRNVKKMQNKPRGKSFKNGHTASVGHGRPSKSTEQKEFEDIEKWRLSQMYTELAHKSVKELRSMLKSEECSGKEYTALNAILFTGSGSFSGWESIVNRLFGKPKESLSIEHSGKISLVDVVRRIGDRNSR